MVGVEKAGAEIILFSFEGFPSVRLFFGPFSQDIWFLRVLGEMAFLDLLAHGKLGCNWAMKSKLNWGWEVVISQRKGCNHLSFAFC